MFLWCLRAYGNLTDREARAGAAEQYPYEPASNAHRRLVFQDTAWHWAMLSLKGDSYWRRFPKLEQPSADYWAEADAFRKRTEAATGVTKAGQAQRVRHTLPSRKRASRRGAASRPTTG